MFYVRFQNPSDYMIQTYLEMSKVIAVVGLSDREETTSNRISKIMQGLGYRRSEFLPDVARDFIETDAKIFWAQLGLQSQEAEEILRVAGRNHIVMNRCIKREYNRLVKEID